MYQRFVKKSVALAMVAVMATGLFAGCGKSEDKAVRQGSTNASSTQQETGKEPVEITLMSFDVDKIAQSEDAPIYKVLRDKLNIKFNIMSSPWNNYNDKLNVSMASGTIPDIFNAAGIANLTQYKAWIKEGFLLPMSDVSASYPNLDKQLKKFDSFKASTDGKNYGLPVASYMNISSSFQNDHAIYVRKDWLDNLGLGVPTTLDEFYNVAKAFTTQDPDKDGKQDTYGYTSADKGLWWHYPIFNAFGTSFERYKKVDGKWTPELIQNETKDAVIFLKKLYDEKIMDPEFMLNNGDKKIEKFVAGKVGIIVHNGGVNYNGIYDKFKTAYPDKDPKTMFTYTGILAGKDGNKRLDGWPNYWMYTFVSDKSSQEKKAKALELLDYLCSDEGLTLMRWGIEGQHYKKDGDKFVTLLPMDEKGKQQTIVDNVDGTARLKSLITWDNDNVPDNTPNKDEVVKCGREGIESGNPDPLFGLVLDEKAASPELSKVTWDYTEETLVKMIVKSSDINKDWDNFVKNWLAKGGQKVWDETNRKALEENR